MPKKCNNPENHTDIAVLKSEHNATREFIKKMEENHLPHLYNRLSSIETKLAYWGGGIAVLVVVSQVVLAFIFQ